MSVIFFSLPSYFHECLPLKASPSSLVACAPPSPRTGRDSVPIAPPPLVGSPYSATGRAMQGVPAGVRWQGVDSRVALRPFYVARRKGERMQSLPFRHGGCKRRMYLSLRRASAVTALPHGRHPHTSCNLFKHAEISLCSHSCVPSKGRAERMMGSSLADAFELASPHTAPAFCDSAARVSTHVFRVPTRQTDLPSAACCARMTKPVARWK